MSVNFKLISNGIKFHILYKMWPTHDFLISQYEIITCDIFYCQGYFMSKLNNIKSYL